MTLYDRVRNALHESRKDEIAIDEVADVLETFQLQLEAEARAGDALRLWYCPLCTHDGDPEMGIEVNTPAVWAWDRQHCPSCHRDGELAPVDERLKPYERAAIWMAITDGRLYRKPFGADQ